MRGEEGCEGGSEEGECLKVGRLDSGEGSGFGYGVRTGGCGKPVADGHCGVGIG